MEEVMGGLVNCQLPSGLSSGSKGIQQGEFNWPLPRTYPQGASIPALQILLNLSVAT
jgi:hypothetical protein